MRTSKYFLITSLLLLFFSCENLLVENPQSFIAPQQYFKTENEVESAIYGVYNYFNDLQIGEYLWILMGDLGTDVSVTRPISQFSYQFTDMLGCQPETQQLWLMLYKAVGASNLVIERVNSNENLPSDFKKRIIAEAKFLRASFYYRLNLIWGNVPLWLNDLNLDEVEKLPVTSSEKVKEQIIQDLLDAANDLPLTVAQNGRANSWIAKGLLARVYLFDNQWSNARDLAKDIIDNSGYSLLPKFSDVFDPKKEFNNELIHVIPKLADINPSLIHSHSAPRPTDDGSKMKLKVGVKAIRPDGVLTTDVTSRTPGSLFQGWGIFQTTKENYESFNPKDSRKDMWWHEVKLTDGSTYTLTGGSSVALPGKSGYHPLKWIYWDEAASNGGRDMVLQRMAEIYLIYAEAENELNGPANSAYEAINAVRSRAFGDNDHNLSGLSKDQFRNALIDENRWELSCEGLRRWYLWHWGYDVYMKAANFVSNSNPLLGQNLKPYHKYFRIPDQEIVKNPNLQQNPGYE